MSIRQIRIIVTCMFACGVLCFLSLFIFPGTPLTGHLLRGGLILFTLIGTILNYRFSRCEKCNRVIPLTVFRKIDRCPYCNAVLHMDNKVT